MKKIFSVMVLVVAMILASGLNNQVSATSGADIEAWVVEDIDYLSLMSGPSPSYNYDELARIPPGARIVIHRGGDDYEYSQWKYDYNKKFVRATYNGIKGFVHSGYIVFGRILRTYP